MNCKNCGFSLNDNSNYCLSCGAKVVGTITLKGIISDFVENAFGWDNKYFVTFSGLLIRPGKVISSYLGGTRKRYMNPMGFLLINLTIVLFIFNVFSEEYLSMARSAVKEQTAWMAENLGSIYAEESFQRENTERSMQIQKFILNYMNITTLLSLPIYALFSWIVFRKKHNYGEHLVINAYLQGFIFIFSSLFFILSINSSPAFYYLNFVIIVFFYCFTYKQLYNLSIAEIILKLLIFIGVLILALLVITVLLIIVGVAFALLEKFFFS